MAFYLDEEEVWKCQTHPSKRRRSGVCPTCLRDRLVTLCPECANTRPCACCFPAAPIVGDSTTSSSSSSSSSISRFQFTRGGSLRDGFLGAGGGEVGRVSSLIESEPAFRKSRSLAIPFLRSRSKYSGGGDRRFVVEEEEDRKSLPPRISRRKIGFWSMFRSSKTKKCDLHGDGLEEDSNRSDISSVATDDYSRMMRSRSVAVGAGAGDGFSPVAVKRRGWYFPSPMKAFRQSKLHERSPMHRG